MVIEKCKDVFSDTFSLWGGGGLGQVEGVTWEDISMEELIMREQIFHEGGAGFSSIIKKKRENKLKKSYFNWK